MSNIEGGRTIYYVNIYDEAEHKTFTDSLVG